MCYAGHPHRYDTSFEITDERMDVRASDAERDAVVESLRGHAQAGRLTSDELEERVELALAAKTREDLARLQRDLPAPARRVPPRPRPQQRRGHPPFASIAVLLIAIWAVSGGGYFWPIWPLLWFAFIAMMRSGHTRVTGNNRHTW